MRFSVHALFAAVLFSVTGTSCAAEKVTERKLVVEDELHILQVSYPSADIAFWQEMVGKEVMPGLVLQSVEIQQDCGDHVHAFFFLKPPASPEQEQHKPEPKPQQAPKPLLQEQGPPVFA